MFTLVQRELDSEHSVRLYWTAEVVIGKRKRKQVDYAALNATMFGDFESYEGEGSDDNYET